MEAKTAKPVIAIIDDDDDVRETLSALMEESGFSSLAYSDSKSFLDSGDPPPVDLALIDLRLRGESGLNLAIHLRERCKLPIVMLTGVGDEIDKIIGLETGADDYLIKPFNPRELVARIRAVLRRYDHSFAPASVGFLTGRATRFRLPTQSTGFWNISSATRTGSSRVWNFWKILDPTYNVM